MVFVVNTKTCEEIIQMENEEAPGQSNVQRIKEHKATNWHHWELCHHLKAATICLQAGGKDQALALDIICL